MQIRGLFFLFLFALAMMPSKAQVTVKDSIVNGWIIHAVMGYHFPGGDLSERFHENWMIGPELTYKTHTNWHFGLGGRYVFGNGVRIRESILRYVSTANGPAIGLNGDLNQVRTYQRGWNAYAMVGHTTGIWGHNPNSGLHWNAGLGYMQNLVFIEVPGENVPSVTEEFRHGFDRLHSGVFNYLFLGYMHAGNTKMINFTIGIESMLGATRNVREFNYDTREFDRGQKWDWYIGLRASWFLPIYDKSRAKFFYY